MYFESRTTSPGHADTIALQGTCRTSWSFYPRVLWAPKTDDAYRTSSAASKSSPFTFIHLLTLPVCFDSPSIITCSPFSGNILLRISRKKPETQGNCIITVTVAKRTMAACASSAQKGHQWPGYCVSVHSISPSGVFTIDPGHRYYLVFPRIVHKPTDSSTSREIPNQRVVIQIVDVKISSLNQEKAHQKDILHDNTTFVLPVEPPRDIICS